MLNSSTLDTLIAVVIVLLVLSLVVQSVQQGLKKFFKIKSLQIEDSLVDLFEHVLDKPSHMPEGWWDRVIHHSPLLRVVLRYAHPAEHEQTNDEVKELFTAVQTKLKQIGRVAQSGKLMLDSIAKQDLLNVLLSVEPKLVTPNFGERFNHAVAEFNALKTAVEGFKPSEFAAHMSPEAKDKLATLQGALRPLITDASAYLKSAPPPAPDTTTSAPGGDAASVVPSEALVRDLMRLREVRLADVVKLLNEAQKAVEEQLAKAQQDPAGGAVVTALTAGADALRQVAAGIISLEQTVQHVLGNLKRAEQWYDTVMQSFEERYTRGMRTWGLVISFAVVAVLNANFFTVFRNIAASDTLRNSIIQSNDAVAQRLAANATQNGEAQAEAATRQTVQTWFQETKSQISNDAQLYTGYGFSPLKPGNMWRWWNKQDGWENATPWQYWTLPLYTLFGWIIMTMLLSVGAPFWQDTLESLFGIKNVLRKRSDTKNVEDKGGQPRS